MHEKSECSKCEDLRFDQRHRVRVVQVEGPQTGVYGVHQGQAHGNTSDDLER